MSIKSLQRAYFFILLTLLVGKGDGQWKKSPKDVLYRDIRIYKKMTEKIKREFEDLYSEYSHEPVNDYFLEEIDYVESKIKKYFSPKIKIETSKDISSNANPNRLEKHYNVNDEIHSNNISAVNPKSNNYSHKSSSNITNSWPKFEEILLAIGKQYDWKNDRWIKVKAKIKDKLKMSSPILKYDSGHQKHNFKYRIVKLNRAKSKKKVVIAVSAVR